MSWIFKPAAGLFEEVRKDWYALNASRGNHLLLDSRFVAPLLRHFGGPHVLLGINPDSRNPGMALLIKKAAGRWETFQPAQAPLGLILVGYRDQTGEGLLEMLGKLPGYPLELSVLQQDPDYSSFPAVPSQPHLETLDYIRTARLRLAGTFEDYWNSRGINLRHNLARQQRRLSEQGYTIELGVHRAPQEVAACIREYGRLESRGWKGKKGTAVAEDNGQGRFYRDVFEAFCAAGEGVIYQLLVNGKVAANDLCLVRDGMLIVLKTAYNENLANFSPALMMRRMIMERLHAEKQVRVVEFYGPLMDWHTRWCDEVRTMFHLNCFRHRLIARIRRFARRLS